MGSEYSSDSESDDFRDIEAEIMDGDVKTTGEKEKISDAFHDGGIFK